VVKRWVGEEELMNSQFGKIFVWVLATVLLTTAFSAQAQQAKKLLRIGYLSALSPAAESSRSEIIRQALREFGYVEGQNIAIEYRYSEGKPDRAAELAADLVRLKVEIIIVAGGDRWIAAARKTTKTIPIVMTGGGLDPVEAGHVESLARPGGNVTGLTILNTELSGKRLELLGEAVPKLARVAVLCDQTIPSNAREQKDIQRAALALGLTVRSWDARDSAGIDKVFAAMGKERPDGLYVCQGGIMNNSRKLIADTALKSQLPSVYSNIESVVAGGLMYYGTERADSYRRVAWYVDKILKGTKPADIPVEQPTKFEFVINLKTAKQIGLAIPPNVLARADRVIR
jgi:putative ABC transport system substrate-binding protein